MSQCEKWRPLKSGICECGEKWFRHFPDVKNDALLKGLATLEERTLAALKATTHDEECHPSEGKHSPRCLRTKALIAEAEGK
jgi:hypothetical protein